MDSKKEVNQKSLSHLSFLKKRYSFLSLFESISKGLDWGTMPLLLFWIPISFVTLSQPVLIALLVATAISTLAVLIYTAVTAYRDDQSTIHRLEIENTVENPLKFPQENELSIKKDFLLSMITTTTTLFSFFWVVYDALVTLEVLANVSMPLLPLIGIPVCMAISAVFGYLHYSKLKKENELYQILTPNKNDEDIELKDTKIQQSISDDPNNLGRSKKTFLEQHFKEPSQDLNNVPTNISDLKTEYIQ